MGSVGSKAAPSASSSRVRVGSKAHRVLQSSCLGVGATSQSQSQSQSRSQSQSHDDSDSDSDSDDDNNNDDDQACDPRNKQNATNFTGAVSNQPKIKCYRKVKVEKSDQIASNDFTDTCSTNASSSSSSTTSSSSRFLSRFSFIPGNISFRLSRANSLGSSTTMNNEQDVADQHHQDVPISSSASSRVNLCSPRNHSEMDTSAIRHAREPIERNVRFSRTLSVGRLRDRVIRRSSLSDIQQVGEVRDTNQAGTLAPVVSPNSSAYPLSTVSSSFVSNQNFEVETSRAREARYHDLLEHTSNFLERRRRIRSQVRALQRLGSRFENLSGHERSCILSGQHRTGRCTCRPSNRDPHLNDDTSARASISRIVMLAEALFEVLDEIQQQSVVLSSRPSVSSIGSVPAPNEVVESLPVKLYTKLQKHQNEEVAQCYICLGEYEEGDRMRILPCHHEFHKTCVDKWLKEIHRVCPLCRGDICRSVSLPAEN